MISSGLCWRLVCVEDTHHEPQLLCSFTGPTTCAPERPKASLASQACGADASCRAACCPAPREPLHRELACLLQALAVDTRMALRQASDCW
jgi:hypothetical protein